MHSFKCLDGRHHGYALPDLQGQEARPPRCPECGDLMRPDVVWFGEALPDDALRRAQRLAGRCDAMLMAGTSAIVYPAAGLPFIALDGGAALIDVNPEPSALSHRATHFLQGKGGDVLPRLVAAVTDLIGGRPGGSAGHASDTTPAADNAHAAANGPETPAEP